MSKITRFILGIFSFIFISIIMLTLLAAQSGNDNSRDKNENISSNKKEYILKKAVKMDSGIIYGISKDHGFLISFDNGKTWEERNRGLPRRVIYPFKNIPVRRITSFAFDPSNEGVIALTTANGIYLTTNHGLEWKEIPTGKPLRSTSYFTAVAIYPGSKKRILVGTSFNGFFETKDAGITWTDPSIDLKFLYKGAGFYEEITSLTYIPGNPESIYFVLGFEGDLYKFDTKNKKLDKINLGNDIKANHVRFDYTGNNKWKLIVETNHGTYQYNNKQSMTLLSNYEGNRYTISKNLQKKERLRRASNKFGIYVSSHRASGDYLQDHLNFIIEHGLNSLVVDFKDDYGYLTYNSKLDLPQKMKAIRKRINLEKLLKEAHKRGIYVVGRVVVFKDEQLFNYNNYKYALWDSKKNQPWRNLKQIKDSETGTISFKQNEYWVDPFSQFVWKYNIAIAEELQKRGVDEIQFDYIRFPSDGNLSIIQYRYRKNGMSKTDAVESFLKMARSRLHIPISTDLYGFNSWYRMGNWIGQSIEMISDYADVICPMFYPSHFPIDFMKGMDYLERAYFIYSEGTKRAKRITSGRALIRPFIQAFLLGGELNMTTDKYSNYLISQVQGTIDSPASGFTLWNASNRYYMVRISLKSLLEGDKSR